MYIRKIFAPELTDEQAISQMENVLKQDETAVAALMGDAHVGYSVPVGGVVAHKNKINLSGVGFDIACGNAAVLTDIPGSWLRENVNTVADEIFKTISFGVGRVNDEKVEHPVLDDPRFKDIDIKNIQKLASDQLGTVGSGNHYVDVFTDTEDRVWVGVHFGSRGLGHKITTHFLERNGAKDGMFEDSCLLDWNSDIGREYWIAMELAGDYAYAGRDWVVDRVTKILGGQALDRIHNHHNFAWLEEHDGQNYIVVRKGATPAFPGQRGFVGGSMGDNSVILEGVDSDESKNALYSTVHGAGRVISRRKAAGKTKWKSGKKIQVSEGEISVEMMTQWVTSKNVTLRGAGVDESPHCYKRLDEVLKAHNGTIKVTQILTPVIVCMAGDTFDPYKD